MNDLPPPTGSPVSASEPYYPPHSFPAQPLLDQPKREHPTLPLRAAVGAMVVLTASLLISKYVLDWLVGFRWPVVVYVALLAVIGYGPSLAWCKYVSTKWGTGSFFDDVGLTPRWTDLGWGPVVWLAAVGTQVAIAGFVLALDVPLSNNTDGISDLTGDRTYLISIVIAAVIAAPFVEEIVFRGVVMRGLRGVLPAVASIGTQAVLFGVAHVDPVRGAGNIGLVLVLSGVGAAFGGAAYLLRRIGPTIVAHAIFNGVVLVLVITRVAERLQN